MKNSDIAMTNVSLGYRGVHLFVYGTLLLPQIMQGVCGQRYFSEPAILPGYARYGLRGKRYPGIVSQEHAKVAGMLYLDLQPAAWRRLDRYEDYFYQRQRVQVATDNGQILQAWTYIIPEEKRHLLTERAWSLRQFRQRHLQGFMQHIASTQHI
jgi:gamma-glutamylcyclotransferase (GGCT)/AIG2-like uncharacterized protein YtfP